MAKIGVMASGSGSNFQSIIANVLSGQIPDSEIVLLVSDKADAYALERAKKAGIKSIYLDPCGYGGRQDYDSKIADLFEKEGTDLICLAGYMRIVTDALLSRFPNAVMNIHPALLPSFPGLHAQKQQLEYGVKVAGCTVHYVNAKVDHGPIIVQAAVPVLESDDEGRLSKRILEKEHLIYPQAIMWHVMGMLKVTKRRVTVEGVAQAGRGLQVL